MAWLATVACLAWVAVLLGAELIGDRSRKRIAKPAASACFVTVALAGGALHSWFGMWLLAGLFLGALGDIALIGHRARALAGGMGLFAAGHVCYLIACASLAPPSQWLALSSALPYAGAAAVLVWLWPRLGPFRIPVLVYVTLLATVVVAAWAPLRQPEPILPRSVLLAAGATSFMISDIAVARHRFVRPGFVNKAWGLPCYFVGQLLIAWSVAA